MLAVTAYPIDIFNLPWTALVTEQVNVPAKVLDVGVGRNCAVAVWPKGNPLKFMAEYFYEKILSFNTNYFNFFCI